MKGKNSFTIFVGIVTVIGVIFGIMAYFKPLNSESPVVEQNQTVEENQGTISNVNVGQTDNLHIYQGDSTPVDDETGVKMPSSSDPSGLRLLYAEEIRGGVFGYTPSTSFNPLIDQKVDGITETCVYENYNENPAQGLQSTAVMQRLVKMSNPFVHSCTIVVYRFEEMPPFVQTGAGMEFSDALEATFLIERKSETLPTTATPWEFTATHYRLVKGLEINEEDVSFTEEKYFPGMTIADSTPGAFRVYVSSRHAGVYWINCFMNVSDGVLAKSKESLPIFEKPMVLAFFDPKLPQNTESQLENVEGNKDWILVP